MKKKALVLASLLAVVSLAGCSGKKADSSSSVTSYTSSAPVSSDATSSATSSENVPEIKTVPLVDTNYNQAKSNYDMHDLLVSTTQVIPALTLSMDEYYAIDGYAQYFQNVTYTQYNGESTSELYINVNAKNSYFSGYSMKDYYGTYPAYFQKTVDGVTTDYYEQLVSLIGETNTYTLVNSDISAILNNIGVTFGWGEGYGSYFAFVKNVTDYYQNIKTYCDANADEDGYAPLTEEIREDLMAISQTFYRSTGYYQYFTFISTGEPVDTGYVPLCDESGSTKSCVDGCKAYISVNDNFEYKFTNGNSMLAGVDMTTYYAWYPSMFASVGTDYYELLINEIGETADADGYALVTSEMHDTINTMAHLFWGASDDDYCSYFCFVKNEDNTFTEWDSDETGRPTDVDLYVNPTKKMDEFAYNGVQYSIYDYKTYFKTTGTDYYKQLLNLIDGKANEDGYVEVTEDIETCLDNIGKVYFGYDGYGYEFMFVKASDVINEK